ncbi:homoserine dehydrogenase [Lichenibacterium dinghuense]|uniref:homoserine dehydrogenase n=1 Tax=Lichenibacterium dinghuense TaxID=2895977 RepID=UPI001F3FA2CF|nr:homoserine dehydrogenase [Lichenibacterium sp. 6Y81]
MSPLRVGIAGLGTVGGAVLRRLTDGASAMASRTGRPVAVVGVSARDRAKAAPLLGTAEWFDDPVALARAPGIDVFVELIGGHEGVAREAVEAAIASGKSVVTANKALLAHHGMALAAAAEARGVSLSFEAAVAGGIPAIKVLREALSGNAVDRVYGILNGTCNYILTRMEAEGIGFEACLAEAQRLGYAEADPTFDIDGHDTAHKLAILASLAFGTAVDLDAIHVEGIRSITSDDLKAADDLGYRVKLLGVAQRTDHGIETRVHPTMVAKGTALAEVKGVTNAVAVNADAVAELTLVGPGAGGDATASAVLGDIADLARGSRVLPFGRPAESLERAPRAPMQRHEGGYYVRLAVLDRPGSIAAIATRMAAAEISFESIMQRQPAASLRAAATGHVPVVLITHATSETTIREALDAVEAGGTIAGKPQLIRIERG